MRVAVIMFHYAFMPRHSKTIISYFHAPLCMLATKQEYPQNTKYVSQRPVRCIEMRLLYAVRRTPEYFVFCYRGLGGIFHRGHENSRKRVLG